MGAKRLCGFPPVPAEFRVEGARFAPAVAR